MSMMTCLIIFSGSSALSIRSCKFARTNAETLSRSAITPPVFSCQLSVLSYPFLRFLDFFPVADGLHLQQEVLDLHPGERLEERRHLSGHLSDVAGDLVYA